MRKKDLSIFSSIFLVFVLLLSHEHSIDNQIVSCSPLSSTNITIKHILEKEKNISCHMSDFVRIHRLLDNIDFSSDVKRLLNLAKPDRRNEFQCYHSHQ